MPGVKVITLELEDDLPIVGCELTPKLRLLLPDGETSTDDVPESSPVDGTYLRYKWYRVLKNRNALPCHLHPEEATTFQCQFCSKRKSLLANSYHCSSQCYQEAWAYHRDAHEKSLADGEQALLIAPKKIEIQLSLGTRRTYTPRTEDLGCVLRFECAVISANCRRTVVGEIKTISTPPVVPYPTPIPRKLIGGYEKEIPRSFSVLTYNILSDTSANTSQYSYCPPWARSWTYRRLKLLQEIVDYNADLVCLQDVQHDHLVNFFAPELHKRGYDFRYTKRTNEVLKRVASVLDGCATFFKLDKFVFVEKYDINFNNTAQAWIEELDLDLRELASNRLLQGNIALLVLLELKFGPVDPSEQRQRICVANAYLDMEQDLRDVKLWQIHTLLKEMENIALYFGRIPMIICGDFNITPRSAPHSLFLTNRVNPNSLEDPFQILKPYSKLIHRLPLESAYSALLRLERGSGMDKFIESINSITQEPWFTKYTKDYMGCNDYIFYTVPKLRLEGLLELVDFMALGKYTAIPSKEWPSSHIALLAHFSCVADRVYCSWREIAPWILDPVMFQERGICWAISLTRQLQALFRQAERLDPYEALSIQELVDVTNWNSLSENGVIDLLSNAVDPLTQIGTVSEEYSPLTYQFFNPESQVPTHALRYRASEAIHVELEEGEVDTGFEDKIIQALKVSPVAATVQSYGSLGYIFNEVYAPTYAEVAAEAFSGYHTMLLTGYGETEDGVPFWEFQDSCGLKQGEHGFIRVARGMRLVKEFMFMEV